jgi:uncharacterized membrane protein YqiK
MINYSYILITAGIFLTGMFLIGMIIARLYVRASKEISYVRTGLGGQRVIMNGGAFVFPVLHEIIPVNMNTLRLAVKRSAEQALITKDRMRVDVVAEFYVRCQPVGESIANAAQTLGKRTMHPQELKDLVEGKFVDALRSVAAEMSMEELHEKRIDFVQKVQHVVSEDILKNGLELESVSLTSLDQTSKEYFNPDNAFDAQGLTKLTQEIELRRKIRNDIEQETQVQIKQKNLEAEKRRLEIERQEKYASLEQQREIEIKHAVQKSEIEKQRAIQEQEAEQSRIIAEQQVEASRIEAARMLEKQRIAKELLISTQEINKAKEVELAEQDRAITIAEKSKEQSIMQAKASEAQAIAVAANEQVTTAQEKEIAVRQKQIELIEAAKKAEYEAINITIAAKAQKEAAFDSAQEITTRANANAEKITITANAQAQADKIQAQAKQVSYQVEAEGIKAINEANNIISPDQIAMQIKIKLIENIDKIIRESVKPLENIEGIKIINTNGFGVGTNVGTSDEKSANFSDQVINSALKFRAQAPIVDSLLKDIGLDGTDINSLNGLVSED